MFQLGVHVTYTIAPQVSQVSPYLGALATPCHQQLARCDTKSPLSPSFAPLPHLPMESHQFDPKLTNILLLSFGQIVFQN